MAHHTFTLNSEYIELDKLLKLLAIAPSGGIAKMMVAEGAVSVDGELETRKTRKLRAGCVVEVAAGEFGAGETIRVVGADGA
ncbi:RNA-binding S4 domain-containing protein [Uliginosibacterium sp. H3]|uniref:RNA-binding S4 domain-containing protein n=1 Tax=Uliginosibacterium silvisoli TaxID=3114758 RepID=A0ABU6JZM6_9RHOO|nr:RNA-binding S4 domain-containing protein [Uliginosibacterium sp. H3]